MSEMQTWAFGAIPLFRVFTVWAELGEVGQMGFHSLCKGEHGFQPNNEVMDFSFPEFPCSSIITIAAMRYF